MPTSIAEGPGNELLSNIRKAPRAIVFISVPWSGPERVSRRIFEHATSELGSNLGIDYFRLEVDEDNASRDWLSSIGFSELATAGAGSLLWLESGRILASAINANSIGIDGIVQQTTSLWKA